MKNENACCFELLGKLMTVETRRSAATNPDDLGSCLLVTWDDIVIADHWGECFTWPENLCLLHGAARQSSIDKALRVEGEASLRLYIQTAEATFD